MYDMETVGDRPSLRYEVNIAKARKMYPMDVKPVPIAGFNFVPVRVPGQGTYTEGNKPFVDFNAVVAGTDATRRFVHDDRAVANIILGKGIPPPALTERGHFHPESAEFWFILLGKIRYNIEGMQVFEADQGDIVYVPEAAVPPRELRGRQHVVPPGDERIYGPVAFVRGPEPEIRKGALPPFIDSFPFHPLR